MNVQEIESAVAELLPEDLSGFAKWFEEYRADQWDRQFESDARGGKLDALAARANRDFEAGRATELEALRGAGFRGSVPGAPGPDPAASS